MIEGDISELDVDAIVNAANEYLAHGGGVAGVISRKGGPAIQQESDAWVRANGPVPTGSAAITSGGRLKARHVIHAVGPVYDRTHRSAELLASAYRESLKIASARGIKSLAFPSLSTGVYGYPVPDAARVALKTVKEYLAQHPEIELVRFVLFGKPTFEAYTAALQDIG